MAIRVHALGSVRVERDGRNLDRLPAQRVRLGVLLYLTVEREASREAVMGTFWPDRPPERARHLLSQTLYELRQDLGEEWVRTAGEQLVVAGDVVTDVGEMEAAVEAGDYGRALELYRGPLQGGGAAGLTREFEGWLDGQQARLTRLHRQARRSAIDEAVEGGALPAAVGLARAWVEMDPLDDEAQHRFIELLAATGDRAGALRQYERYATLVERELELEPLDETQALIARVREGELGPRQAAVPETAMGVVASGEHTVADRRAADEPGEGRDRSGAGQPPVAWWRGRGARIAAASIVVAAAAVLARAVFPSVRPPTVTAALDPRRVAVLFFDDNSREQDLGPVAAGFTEALIHELDQVAALEVLSRTAVEAFRDRRPPMDTLVAALGAGTFVDGSITRWGDSLTVTFQLIDGATATPLMSGSLTRPASEVAALSRELPREVARRLRERLGPAVELREMRRGTDVGEAWLHVQRAQILQEDAQATWDEDLEAAHRLLARADSLLAEAERADPAWPEPIYRRAVLEMTRAAQKAAIPSQREPEGVRRAMDHLERALRLDPDHVAALEQRGILRFDLAESAEDLAPAEFERLRALAESDLRRAVALDPQRARAWWGLSRVLRRKGSFAEAKQAARRALAADAFLEVPVEGLWQIFHTSLEKEEHEEALEWCDELRRRYPDTMRRVQCEILLMAANPLVDPDSRRGWALVDTMAAMGDASRESIYRGWATLYVGKILVREGRTDSARAVLRRVVPEPTPDWAPYDAAHLSLLVGDVPGALRYLEIYLDANPEQAIYLPNDWWFRELHGDRRFRALLERPATEGP